MEMHVHGASASRAGFLPNLFESFTPRQQCMNYEPDVIWLHFASDLVIALAYFSIPVALTYFARKRKDLAHHAVFSLFALFIILCGTTHIFSIWALWQPRHRLDGVIKLLTATASAATAIVVWYLMPRALAVPSAADLTRRKDELERLVEERTAELAGASRALARERAVLNGFLGAAPVGMCVWDTDFRYLRINEALASINGIPSREHSGHTLAEMLPTLWPTLEVPLRRALHGETVRNIEISGETPKHPSEARHWLASYYPVHSAEGELFGIGGVVHEVTEARRAVEALRQAEEQMRSVVDHVVDGIITIDEQGTIASFNAAAEKVFGYQAVEVLGRNVKLLMPEPYHSEHDGYLANYLHSWQPRVIGIGREVVGRRSDGSTFPMELAVSEFHLGARRFFTGIVRDITQRKQLEDELQRHLCELSAADRRKDEFLAMLAHELRNPLAGLTNAVQLVIDVEDREQTEWSLGVMNRQIRHLARLIDDLLDVSRITRGKIQLRKEIVDVAPIMKSAVEVVQPLLDVRKHELRVSVTPGELWLEADPTRLEQILSNLLNNAAKYTDNGGRIWFSAEPERRRTSASRSAIRASASRPRSCRRCSSCSPRGTHHWHARRGSWALV
jgi:PAS domain S-box-containing protein